jgi:uncharacterized protein
MKIIVDHIQDNKPFSLHAEDTIESFPMLTGMQSNGDITFIGPVQSDIIVRKEYDHLRVEGRVNTQVSLTCSRCLATFETSINSLFTIIFRKGTSQNVNEEEEIELDEQDLISATYIGDEIDLAHEIEEQVAMEVTSKPLCSEECKGLCPVCGIDMNKNTCSCSRKELNLKFSALKDFKVSR